ncbi:MAG: bifunctional DNA-formamidopyrimidine glycosylase/DNA-(apurinic or apyrimidinic site) lyase [Candidatus Kerfeldbacteria bacterium]|nr:bifunctional DNA-formamidopyrimidine glycosylase/DNA-(apurinic or apyrimidinic site) lyase [Candidatus Kerfeldbacteria bacterium]
MPELPEVQTIVDDLHKVLKKKRILSIRVTKPRLLHNPLTFLRQHLVGATIRSVRRRAKLLLFDLSSGYTLIIHLKMTGQLIWRSHLGKLSGGGHPIVGVASVPNRYTHITIDLSGGSRLYFNDVRQFGYFKLLPTSALVQHFSSYGPEPLSVDFSLSGLRAELQRRRRSTIKAALLNQQVVAGIGNIYADESLFVAGLSPSRRVGRLTQVQAAKLYRAIRQVLKRAVHSRGTSFSNYVDGLGRTGTYWPRRLVYGRAGSPCRRCGRTIKRTVVAGRGTNFCPHCQK